jgi:hypothetical protein
MLYRGVKTFLDDHTKEMPSDLETCRDLAGKLAAHLEGSG